MIKRTLVIIKPNAVKDKNVGKIINRIEETGFIILGIKMIQLSREEAESFYYVHRGKPFFKDLIDFMTSDKCITMVLEGNYVITNIRNFVGDTDPEKAKKGTIRYEFGDDLSKNAIHASDGIETSKFEVNFFFPEFSWETGKL